MAENFITRGISRTIDRLAQAIAVYITPERKSALDTARQYYEGTQKRPLKLRPGQADDNLITNFVGLAVDRANSMLFGGGVDFTVPTGADSEPGVWLDAVWQANKKNILLQRAGMNGEIFGTPFVKILPDAVEHSGALFPRLVLLDPSLMAVETDPMDIERVTAYIFEMKVSGEDRTIREITRRAKDDGEIIVNDANLQEGAPGGSWIVERWESGGRSSAWVLLWQKVWPYPFPPIHHWQNLPSIHSVYGANGIGGGLDIQDKYNFVTSNILKIIRYHAHPKTWGRGMPTGTNSDKVSWGGDEMIKFSSENAMVANLEMQSDMAGSRAIQKDLRQTIFDLARVVDIASITDKVGALTNFGLRVLYSDALAKNSTRRELYGDALMEINRRLLVMAGYDGANAVVWGSDLPQDEREDAELIREDLLAGLVSRETAAEKRGYQWKTTNDGEEGEQDKISAERATDTSSADAALARLFAGNDVPQ